MVSRSQQTFLFSHLGLFLYHEVPCGKKQDGSKIETWLSFSTSFHEEVSGKGVRNLIVNSTYSLVHLKEDIFFNSDLNVYLQFKF